jgi:hypothetical protein
MVAVPLKAEIGIHCNAMIPDLTDARGEDNQYIGKLAATLGHECVPTNPTCTRSRGIINAFSFFAH